MNVIFFHIATINHYQNIVDEILSSIKDSGLINEVDKIYLSILGSNDVKLLYNDKIEILFKSDNLDLCEFPILMLLKKFSYSNKANILYLHTKGVNNNTPPINDWRKYMLYFNVFKYKDALEKLKDYDTYGVDLRDNPTLHYSGNFWWTTSNYAKTLPDFNDIPLVISERHKAEFCICYNKGKHYSAWDCGIDVYQRHLHEYPENLYVKEFLKK